MKTKLLKKLRKKASRKFLLVKVNSGFSYYNRFLHDLCSPICSTRQEAEKACRYAMDNFVLTSARKLRRKHPKKPEMVFINYYPW